MNKQRGEQEIKIGGVNYIARPTHQAMAELETVTGKGIIEIANCAFQMRLSSTEVTETVYGCIKAVIDEKPGVLMPWDKDEFKKVIFKEGILKHTPTAVKLISTMVTGETEEEQEEKKDGMTVTDAH